MSTRPTYDPDPLGLIADMEGRPGPLSEWDLVAKMGLNWDEVVDLFGEPPKAVLHLFRGKSQAKPASRRGQTRTSVAPHRPVSRA